MFKIRNLVKQYPGNKSATISIPRLDLPERGLVKIVGKSGSGKTTFLRLLGIVDLNYSGTIEYNGFNFRRCSARQLADLRFKAFGFAFQEDEFDRNLTVAEALMWPLNILKKRASVKQNLIDSALTAVGLEAKKEEIIMNLSGGERKRVGIARAILLSPPVVFLDEPLAAVDHKNRLKLNALFESLAAKSLVVMVTHTTERTDRETVIRCQDGRFDFIYDRRMDDRFRLQNNLSRQRYSFAAVLKKGVKKLLTNRTKVLLTSMALTVGISCLGIAVLLTEGVGQQVKKELQGAINRDAMTIEKNGEARDDSFRGISDLTAATIAADYPQEIKTFGAYYLFDFEDIFSAQNAVYIKNERRTLNFSSLSVRDFANPLHLKESDFVGLDGEEQMLEDEIILMLKENDMRDLAVFLGDVEPENYLKTNVLYLHLDLAAARMEYETECLFRIKHIFAGSFSTVVTNCQYWNEHFIERILKLEPSDAYEIQPEKPWQIRKTYFLSIYPSKFLDFYSSFSFDRKYSEFLIQKPQEPKTPSDRILVLANAADELKASEVFSIYSCFQGRAQSFSLSSPVYGFLVDGRYNGFCKPLFLSRDREKLNELADANYESHVDLAVFQSSQFIIPEGVLKCDLLSSVKDQNITFESYWNEPPLISGSYPRTETDILISSSLATEIYGGPKDALYSHLQGTVLAQTQSNGQSYTNDFRDISFKITGIVEADKRCFYQTPLFPLAFMIRQIGIDGHETLLDGAIVNFQENLNHAEILEFLAIVYPHFLFSFPSELIEEGVDEALEIVRIILTGLSVFSTAIALALTIFVILLFIVEDRHTIGLYLLHGFYRTQIFKYYFIILSAMVFSGFVIASLTVFIISSPFLGLFADSSASVVPGTLQALVAMAFLAVFAIVFGAIFVFGKLKSIAPLDCFKK